MTVLELLNHEQLTMAEVAEADRYLLAHGLDAFFPVHGDLANLYSPRAFCDKIRDLG